MTVLAYACLFYCIGALIIFFAYGIVSRSFKDGLFGIIITAGLAFFWPFFIASMIEIEYNRERKKKNAKRNNRN